MSPVGRCGYNVVHPDGFTVARPNGSGDCLFVLFRSKMEVETRGERVVTDKNHYILFRKGSSQFYKALEPMVHEWFHFESEELESCWEQLGLPFDTLMKAHDPFYISRKVSEIQGELIHNGEHSPAIIEATVRCLFMKLSDLHGRIEQNRPMSKYYEPFVALRNAIYSSPSDSFTVDGLAAKLNMSRSYFQKLYKEMFGVSVTHDVIRNRLEHAIHLLENTTYGIGAIAHLCGYENEVHFMRQFKSNVSMTPSQYRKKHR